MRFSIVILIVVLVVIVINEEFCMHNFAIEQKMENFTPEKVLNY